MANFITLRVAEITNSVNGLVVKLVEGGNKQSLPGLGVIFTRKQTYYIHLEKADASLEVGVMVEVELDNYNVVVKEFILPNGEPIGLKWLYAKEQSKA